MSQLEKVPFATFYPLQKYLLGTIFSKHDFFKWTHTLNLKKSVGSASFELSQPPVSKISQSLLVFQVIFLGLLIQLSQVGNYLL